MKFKGWITTLIFASNCILNGQASLENNIEKKIDSVLTQLTIDEKITLLGGDGFESKPIKRLGIPGIRMTDGPVGVRWNSSTAFPVSIAMAATWNPELINKIAEMLAKETLFHERDMLLAPCVNLVRTPHGGRNFEGFGEDPYLASRMAVHYIKGLENNGVISSVKHFAVNNQEYNRMTISAEVDERVLRELYLPAFKAAVQEAGASTVMAAYNKLNGVYCAENNFLLNKILKDEWGFQGFVVSDWGAVHSSLGTAEYGVDLEMPFGDYLNDTLKTLLQNGELNLDSIDEKVRRLLRVIYKFNLDNKVNEKPDETIFDESAETAYQTAAEGIVLLKNQDNILPIKTESYNKIAVIGPNAVLNISGGGGSSKVIPLSNISPLEVLKEKIGEEKLLFAQGSKIEGDVNVLPEGNFICNYNEGMTGGLIGEYYSNMNLEGKPVLTRIDKKLDFEWGGGGPDSIVGKDNFSVRWTGKFVSPFAGKYELGTISDDGVRLYLDDELKIDNWTNHAPMFDGFEIDLVKGKEYDIKIEFYENGGGAHFQFGYLALSDTLLSDAVNKAADADIAILFLGTSGFFESEGSDRENLGLPENQLELLKEVMKVNENVVIVLNNGGQLLMSDWAYNVKGILEAWFPGQEGARAVADILIGKINPSGKLPYTIPKKWEDCSAYNFYKKNKDSTHYEDGLFIGYRHFDKYKIEPEYPFGFGLSYSKYEIENVNVSQIQGEIVVTAAVSNIGNYAGAETVQVYVSDRTNTVVRAVKELKNFKKVFLQPGESRKVTFKISLKDLMYYSIEDSGWKYAPGTYEISVGNSSAENDLIKKSINVE